MTCQISKSTCSTNTMKYVKNGLDIVKSPEKYQKYCKH